MSRGLHASVFTYYLEYYLNETCSFEGLRNCLCVSRPEGVCKFFGGHHTHYLWTVETQTHTVGKENETFYLLYSHIVHNVLS